MVSADDTLRRDVEANLGTETVGTLMRAASPADKKTILASLPAEMQEGWEFAEQVCAPIPL